MNQEYSTLLDILVEALGSYGPDFRRRLKQDHPPEVFREFVKRQVRVPARGTPERMELLSGALAWLLEGHRRYRLEGLGPLPEALRRAANGGEMERRWERGKLRGEILSVTPA